MDSIQTAKVGVVTVTYNSGEVIDDFMISMLAQDHQDYVLYIIDNASSDDTLEKISKYQDNRIVVITNKDNLGVAEGNNQGIRKSLEIHCSQVLLINNDTVFDRNLIDSLLLSFLNSESDMVVPKIMYHDNPSVLWFAGGYFVRWGTYAKVYGDLEIDNGQYDSSGKIGYAPTCCMLINSSVFSKIGMMDEKYFVYYDDTDFCYRAKKQGINLFYNGNVKMYHKVSSLTGKCSDFTIYHMTRNRIYYFRKNILNLWNFSYLLMCQLRYLSLLLMGQDSWSVFRLRQKAFLDGLKMSIN